MMLCTAAADAQKSLAFSGDGKVVVASGVGPDFPLLYWQWDKNRMLASVKVAQVITRATLSKGSVEHAVCATTGPKVLRFWRLADSQLKSTNPTLGKRELLNYSDHCWFGDDRLLACTTSGEVCVFEHMELKNVISGVHDGDPPLRTIVPFSRGFMVAGDHGVLSIYEHSEDNLFVPLKQFVCAGARSRVAGAPPPADKRPDPIFSLALSPSEDMLVCTSGSCQVSTFPLKDMEILKVGTEEDHFVPLAGGFHAGPVTGLDTCVKRPFVATCSSDRTVRVWNYIERSCELARHFVDEPLAVALHPSGYSLVVGFTDKLRYFNLLADDIRLVQELHLKMCKEVRFAHGGHQFAAVAGPSVVLFNTYTFEAVATLKGHAGPIRSLAFSADDMMLVTGGIDGAIYEWSLDTRQRVEDHVLKSCQYNAVLCVRESAGPGPGQGGGQQEPAAPGSGNAPRATRMVVAAASNDGKLREIVGGQITFERETGGRLTQLALSPVDRLLFAGVGDGGLLVTPWPLGGMSAGHRIAVHSGAVMRLRLSPDGSQLFSCGDDGSLFVFDVLSAEASRERQRREEDLRAEMDTVLVSQSELSERLASVGDLEKRLSEQEMQAAFQQHQQEQDAAKALKREKEEARARAEEAAQRYEALERAKERQAREATQAGEAAEAAHMRAAEELEYLYERKLAAEAARYEALVHQKDDMQSAFEERMLEMQARFREELAGAAAEADRLRREATQTRSALEAERSALKESYEEVRRECECRAEGGAPAHRRAPAFPPQELAQEDEDFEGEISKLKRSHDASLSAEREEALKLKGETAIIRKKFEASKMDMQSLYGRHPPPLLSPTLPPLSESPRHAAGAPRWRTRTGK